MSKKFKGFLSFAILLLLTITLVACNNQAKKDVAAVEEAKAALKIGFTAPDTAASSVTKDLTLPAKQGEVDVTWVSDNTAVVSNAGEVTRPEDENKQVKLTATLKKGDASDIKEFTVTVIMEEETVDPDIQIVADVKAALALGFTSPDTANSVTANLTLPGNQNGVVITWASNNTAVVTNAGVVTRPAADADVKLTATLVKGAVTDTKVFDIKVLAAPVVETGAKAQLVLHYAATLGNSEWVATEDVTLVDTITGTDGNDYEVTWTVTSGGEFFTNEGVVTRPTFTQGDATIVLKADIEDGSSQNFYFLVEKLAQTVEEKIEAALTAVTVVPASPSGYQEVNFVAVLTTKIDGEDVEVTWTTSDATAMTNTGELVSFDDAEEKTVTLTASITFNGVTLTKEVEFKVKGVTTFESFLTALTPANFQSGDKVKVEGVALYHSPVAGGYYLASDDNIIAFVYGTLPTTVKANKLYDVIFNVDIYYGTYQIKNVSFSGERDGTAPVITPVEVTLEDVVALPVPTETNPNHHTLYDLINVEVRVLDPADNYKTFFVPIGLAAETALTDKNSIMVYYQSNINVIKGLHGKKISSIIVSNNGYRSNNIVWNVNFMGTLNDIELLLTDQEVVDTVKDGLGNTLHNLYWANEEVALPLEQLEATIVWSSDNTDVISNTGAVVVPATPTIVTVEATITKGEATATFTKQVLVGTGVGITSTVEEFLAGSVGDRFQLTATVTGIASNRAYTFEDATGATIAYTSGSGVVLEVGYEYTIIGSKGIHNGMIQLAQISSVTPVKGEAKALPAAKDVTEEDLKTGIIGLQGHLININNAVVTKVDSDTYGNITLTLKVGLEEITVKWDSRMVLPAEAKTHLQSIKANDAVNLVAIPLGWNNGALFGYNVETQIASAGLSDEQKVDLDKAALVLLETYGAEFELPVLGSQGTTIAWAANPAANLVDGKLVLPAEGKVTVTLTATISLGTAEETKEFTVVLDKAGLGLPTVEGAISIADFITNKSEDAVIVGVVTSLAPQSAFSIEDATGAVAFRKSGLNAGNADFKVGDVIVARVKYVEFNGLVQAEIFNSTEVYTVHQGVFGRLETVDLNTVGLKVADLEGYKSRTVNLTDVEVTNAVVDNFGSVTITVKLGEDTLNIYWDNRVPNVDASLLKLLQAGNRISVVGATLTWNSNNPRIALDATAQVVLAAAIPDAQLLGIDKNALVLDEVYTEEFTLPTAGAQGSVITWAATPTANLADGKLVLPTEGEVEVTLTATLTLGAETDTKVFIVTLKAPESSEGQETVISIKSKYTTSNNFNVGAEAVINEHLTISESDIVTVTFVQGPRIISNIFNNGSNEIRIYPEANGDGNKLVITLAAGYTFESVTIKFGAQNAGTSVNGGETITTINNSEIISISGDTLTIQNVVNAGSGNRIDIAEIIVTVKK